MISFKLTSYKIVLLAMLYTDKILFKKESSCLVQLFTTACIAGGIAEAFYQKIPTAFLDEAMTHLPEDFKAIIQAFYERLV